MATGAAKREWRITAPVQEQHGLFAALERLCHRRHQCRAQEPPARWGFAPEVNQANLGQYRTAMARRQMAFAVTPGAGVREGFQ